MIKHRLYVNNNTELWLHIECGKQSGSIRISNVSRHSPTHSLYNTLVDHLRETPAQKLGYGIGEEFYLVSAVAPEYEAGTVLEMVNDDGTDSPLFKTPKMTSGNTPRLEHFFLSQVKPLEVDEPASEGPPPSIDSLVTENLKLENEISRLREEIKQCKKEYIENMEQIEDLCRPGLKYEITTDR